MGTTTLNRILPQLRLGAQTGLTDRELLEALIGRRDETAFEVLLRRHGPMVLAVCRRVLGNEHDAEDAFQATFLVLIRKAAAVRKRDVLASWLHGVAYRTAQKARAMNARRRSREQRAAPRATRPVAALAFDLDDELNALPEMYRSPVVLCELQGRSRREAARQLNIPEGTLSSRLATARKTLARRLRQHGWSASCATPAAVPSLLLTETCRAGAVFLAGHPEAGVVSAPVLALTQGVLKAMLVNKLKALTLVLVLVGLAGVGACSLSHRAAAEEPSAPASATGSQPQRPAADDRAKEAAADVAAAQAALQQAEAALKQAEANAAVAKAQLALKEAVLRERTRQPVDKEKLRTATSSLLSRFQHQVPFKLGLTENKDGASLEILDVWGTRPEIEVGGQYLVHGKYVLPRGVPGKLYFYETTEGWHADLPTFDLQTLEVKDSGEFTLLHSFGGPGYFHIQLYGTDPKRSDLFANVYFGTGKTVLHEFK
jgi:RNA polymerase sigma factor (sigma-70 family)